MPNPRVVKYCLVDCGNLFIIRQVDADKSSSLLQKSCIPFVTIVTSCLNQILKQKMLSLLWVKPENQLIWCNQLESFTFIIDLGRKKCNQWALVRLPGQKICSSQLLWRICSRENWRWKLLQLKSSICECIKIWKMERRKW